MASYDLRREIVVAKFQTLLDLIAELDGNTDEIEAKLDAIVVLLTSIDNKVATEATLQALEATANAIEVLLTSIDGKVATEVTLSALKLTADSILTAVQSIDAKVSTEAKQDTIIAELNAIEALLTTLNSTDFATETTLLAIKAKTDQLTFTASKLRTTGEDGGGGGGGSSINEKLLQVDTEGTTTYLGYADPGTLTSASLWAIKRVIETGNDVSITWADGNNNFDNIWDDRLTLTYS